MLLIKLKHGLYRDKEHVRERRHRHPKQLGVLGTEGHDKSIRGRVHMHFTTNLVRLQLVVHLKRYFKICEFVEVKDRETIKSISIMILLTINAGFSKNCIT